MLRRFLLLFLIIAGWGCSSDDRELIDLAVDPPSRKPIDRNILGVNNFFNHPEFGSNAAQFGEIRDTLGIHFVRVLLPWIDAVQPSPSASPDFSAFDDVIDDIPSGVDVLVVLAHTPSWMTDRANWVNDNPRETWVQRWVVPSVSRYAHNSRIIGWEVWNEPDFTVQPSDSVLGLETPENYVDLLERARSAIRQMDPAKLVIMAATRSIQQDFSENLDYNRQLHSLGVEALTDVWNIHYYGEQFENLVRSDGVADFLNGLSVPIWITESGETGPNNQLSYVETTWPFLTDKVGNIQRIYYYEFASPLPLESNFGLKTTDAASPVSDLYLSLRDGR